jgi:hypothetical protein
MSLAYMIVDVYMDTSLRENHLAGLERGSALSDDRRRHR